MFQPVLPPVQVPAHPVWPRLDEAEKAALKAGVREQLRALDAVLVAHYYTDGDLQELADETGGCVSDSLEMARFGSQQSAGTLVVCGVRFMGETAKILNPEKRVLMPDLNATCSLDEGCPADAFGRFCDQYPEHQVVVYANTSAAVKARADWMVTSGIALDIVKHLTAQGQKVLWAPDRHLGRYVEKLSGARDMVFWPGSCVVHEEFKSVALERLRRLHPEAAVLVHPESPESIIEMADVVGSTTALIKAVAEMDRQEFIVATDGGIFHKMRLAAPHKTLIEAPTSGEGATCVSCAHCPWMGMNSLQSLSSMLNLAATPDAARAHQIEIPEPLRRRAVVPIRRMLEFAQSRRGA